jgi:SpoVK/Ycf46/Vps4 family AAA+-type ATPase
MTASHPALSEPLSGSDPSLIAAWDQIIIPPEDKARILSHALLALTLRSGTPNPTSLPIHGLQVLAGPPGTGKTTLARGLASQLHRQLGERLGPVTLVEVNPHALASDLHGQTQRGIAKVFEEHVPALAADGPTVLLLDEAETLSFSRSEASTETNPVDVHKATDAVLSGLDHLARECPNLIIVATTNFSVTVDEAFISRADCVIQIDRPGVEAITQMLRDTLEALAGRVDAPADSPLGKLAGGEDLTPVATLLVGRDGRQARKFVLDVLASEAGLALAPERLSMPVMRAHAADLREEAQERDAA